MDSIFVADTMQARILLAICVLWAIDGATVVQSRRWFAPEVNCWITQVKVPASWDDARRRCETHGAVLASPLNEQLLELMRALIEVRNHSAAYFIGTRVQRSDDGDGDAQEVHYLSVEGRRLDDMPKAVYDEIDQLELERGNCLCMDRRGIRAVNCWDRHPFICYSNESTECGSAPPTTTHISPTSTSTRPTTTSSTTTVATTTPIPAGYTYYPSTGSAYKVHNRFVTWDVANSTCAAEGAHLVVPSDQHEAELVGRLVEGAGGYSSGLWTGIHDVGTGGEMDWRTVHGERLSAAQRRLWVDGRPLGDARYNRAYLHTFAHRLYDWPWDSTMYFTCELAM